MKNEEQEDNNELRASWVEHAYTQSWSSKFRADAEKALSALKAVAATSSDPKVTAAFVEWREKAVMAQWLATGGKK